MPKSPSLSLNLNQANKAHPQPQNGEGRRSPQSPRSPRASQSSRYEMSRHERNMDSYAAPKSSHSHTGPERSPRAHAVKEDAPRPLFANPKASKSSTRMGGGDNAMSIRQVSEGSSLPDSTAQTYPYKQSSGSSPDLTKSLENLTKSLESASISSSTASHEQERYDQRAPSSHGRLQQNTPQSSHSNDQSSSKRPGQKHRFNLLARSRSIRSDDYLNNTHQQQKPARFTPESEQRYIKRQPDQNGMKTAPLKEDRSFRDMMQNAPRNRSADRHTEPDEDTAAHPRDKNNPFSFSNSFKDNPGTDFLNNIKKSGTKAADGLGKAGKGFFGKLARSGSSHERDHGPVLDENYVCKVINLPLVEQTRKTRISKRLAASKDKTEFWMPALPWRCIDYLNMNGCEEEGLYRVPGSGKDVKYWQMRFDKELDINLFDEPNLYDINIIGSMFKAWLRELPDEIFPKATQKKIQESCGDAKSTPQMLKDELSKLPPFNYYLLFAITCHISLLHSCSEKNKMDYRNLCICFQPCMKIEAFCFQFLVLDWRNCWQGCWTEKEYLEREMRILEPEKYPPQPALGLSTPNGSTSQLDDERAVSSGSSKPSTINSSTPERPRPPPLDSVNSREYEDEDATPTQSGHNGIRNELPKLSPMQPLSPIGSI